jgi:hypothetical protein
MLTIGSKPDPISLIVTGHTFKELKKLKIDIKNLDLISDDDLKSDRIKEENFQDVIMLSNPNDYRLFYQTLDQESKNQLNQTESFKIFNEPINNLYQPDRPDLAAKCSYLALKYPNVDQLIIHDHFRSDLNVLLARDILLLQSILMHNSQEVDAIRGLSDLTDEQDNKRQRVLKNIAIASLVNENLHEKSLDILKDIPPQNFTAEDKKIVQLSIDFLSASIILASTENKDEEAISQFNLLEKVLKFYGDKFNTPQHNIALHMPENIAKALEEKKKFEMAVLATHNKETLSPKQFGEISPVAPVLEKDSLQSISKQVILNALKEIPSVTPAQVRVNHADPRFISRFVS